MNTVALRFVALDPELEGKLRAAAVTALPAVEFSVAGSISEALAKADLPAETQILLLAARDPADVLQARAVMDSHGLPRWWVIVVGTGELVEPGFTWLSAENEKSQMVDVFRGAVPLSALARENARLQGDLLAISTRVNHDLRTPLSPIYTSCEILKLTLGESASSAVPLIQSILSSVDEITGLLDRVSFVVKATLQPKPKTDVEMGEIVFGALQRVESRVLRSKTTVIQAHHWPKVSGVGSWLEAMWWNLVVNAVQHAGPAPRVELGWNEANGDFRFWVLDNGKGVAAERRGKLFQPFNRLHQTNAARGLGLSIVQRLGELQGGKCGYETAAEGGARFYFTLPRKEF
jgi:signal transduction histidine kinase